ncbi:MAG: sensor histidine kinase, partial [Chitinophagales bacterium]
YANKALANSQRSNFLHYELGAAKILGQNYTSLHQSDSVVKFLRMTISTNDSIFNQSKLRQFQFVGFSEEQRQKEIEAAKEKFRNQVRFYSLMAALAVFLIIAAILYRNNRQKQKANLLLNSQKLEIESTLSSLKATQKQLIQSEEMASLGEMTAGVAHEIQNPLNFVNNFSELNTELIVEMENEIRNGRAGEALDLAASIRQNMEKINQHGKRADGIVKGMLQHSRVSSGQKEPVELNAFVDEYFRLSYHGMRAKDPRDLAGKSFSCETRTDFDPSIGKINIVPEAIGRALLNLFNNAFYSVSEKKRKSDGSFQPVVLVKTMKSGKNIEITVKDNGIGIPEKNIDKIYQPFFTTKPAGQGTGLGLSLAYDIIVSEHGGELTVNSAEGEFAEFNIRLPLAENPKINPS